MFDVLIGVMLLYTILAIFSSYVVIPLLLREPLAAIFKPIRREREFYINAKFSFCYIFKTVLLYTFWGFIANIISFFLGGFALGFVNYLAKDLITPMIEGLLGIS